MKNLKESWFKTKEEKISQIKKELSEAETEYRKWVAALQYCSEKYKNEETTKKYCIEGSTRRLNHSKNEIEKLSTKLKKLQTKNESITHTNNIDIYLEYLTQEEFNIDSVESTGLDLYHQAKELGHAAVQHVRDTGHAAAQKLSHPDTPEKAGQAVYDAGTGPAGKLAFAGLTGLAAYKLGKAAVNRLRGR